MGEKMSHLVFKEKKSYPYIYISNTGNFFMSVPIMGIVSNENITIGADNTCQTAVEFQKAFMQNKIESSINQYIQDLNHDVKILNILKSINIFSNNLTDLSNLTLKKLKKINQLSSLKLKVYDIKNREDSKALICLVANDAMLERHVDFVPELAYDLIDLSTKPTTIIYDSPKGVAKNLVASDDTLAIRVASDKFCQYLINKFKKPIVSTSANIPGQPTPRTFDEISSVILKGVDYVVNLQPEHKNAVPSAIIKLSNDGRVKVIRE